MCAGLMRSPALPINSEEVFVFMMCGRTWAMYVFSQLRVLGMSGSMRSLLFLPLWMVSFFWDILISSMLRLMSSCLRIAVV